MTELEKMMSGQVFDGMDKEIDAIRTQATLALRAFNNNTDESKRDELQKQLFGKAVFALFKPLSIANSVKPSKSAKRPLST